MEETALIAAAQAGDLDSFNQLVLDYQDRVYHQAWWILKDRETAEDISQDVFILAFKNLSSYRGGSFRAWLMRIVTNASLDELRRRKRRVMFPLNPVDDQGEEFDSPADLADMSDTVECMVERGEMASLLQHSLEKLPVKYRALVQLVDVLEMDYSEAAEALNIPLGTAKSRLMRARLRLREQLQAVPDFFPAANFPASCAPLAY